MIDHMICYNLTVLKSSYECIILSFLVLYIIYPEKLEHMFQHFRRIICSSYMNYKPAYNLFWPAEHSPHQLKYRFILLGQKYVSRLGYSIMKWNLSFLRNLLCFWPRYDDDLMISKRFHKLKWTIKAISCFGNVMI